MYGHLPVKYVCMRLINWKTITATLGYTAIDSAVQMLVTSEDLLNYDFPGVRRGR